MLAATVFHDADTENRNYLNVKEFGAAMMTLGWQESEKNNLQALFHEADTDKNGVIDIDEFLFLIEKKVNL